jgi:hypothetical protein
VLVIGVSIGVAYLPIIQGLNSSNDYKAHASFAQKFLEQGTLISPACLLHLLVTAFAGSGLTASYASAMLAVVVGSHAFTAVVLYLCARWALRAVGSPHGRLLPALIAVAGPFVQPPVSLKATYSIGYIWTEPYLSPTYALLKPFALAAAVFAVYFLAESRKNAWQAILLSAITVAAGTLAKPSFAICAVPALCFWCAYRHARKLPFSKFGVLYAWLLPALAVLMWQYFRTYSSVADRSHYADSIIFAPLVVMRTHAKALAAPYFWSVLLPLSILVVYGKRAWADGGLRFSLVGFLFGTLYTYTLAEDIRLTAGNFLWSAYITLFVLYFFSVVFVVKQVANQPSRLASLIRALPCIAILAWQLTSGVSVHMNYVRRYHQPPDRDNDHASVMPAGRN